MVYYNKALFDAAGVPYPGNDWTWDDFLNAGLAMTKDSDGDGVTDQYGAGIDPILYRLAPFIWQMGGELVDDAANPTQLVLDSPTALAAFQWFVDLQMKHHIVPDAVAEAGESSESRFLNGTLGMFFDSRRSARRPFAPSPISTGMSRPCRAVHNLPASCTATPTAWPLARKQRRQPGNSSNTPTHSRDRS